MLDEMPVEGASRRPSKFQMILILIGLALFGAFYFYLLHEALFNQIKF